ncbi:MAG: phosphotransferase family protein [Pseudomonadota bacterium]
MNERGPEGFNVPAVEAWIGECVECLDPPFQWTRLEGGHSNLTYRLDSADGTTAVIRRPPQGPLLPKAHDMSREWALISALGPTAVPVPRALGFCETPDVTGAWFYVMGWVEASPLYNAEDTIHRVPKTQRVAMARDFFGVLASLHKLAPDDIGLGDLAKKDGYVARQLSTWYRSWTASADTAQFDDPRVHRLKDFFAKHMPQQGPARVVHGDYGLHNCLIGRDARVAAVVDWEIATLGDPLADLAYALNPWPEQLSDEEVDLSSATSADGFPSRSELAQHYADLTGANLEQLEYYVGFNGWKSAAILQGVYARYQQGNKSAEGADLVALRSRIGRSLDFAERAVHRYEMASTGKQR